MRFVVCARDRETGAIMLVAEESFPNRREAIEAIVGFGDADRLLGTDVFLVDLDAAAPVAVVAVGGPVPGIGNPGPDGSADESMERLDGTGPAEDAGGSDSVDGALRLGLGEIDIESWTCEDCIYIVTCEKSGTLRPVECASFQWRA